MGVRTSVVRSASVVLLGITLLGSSVALALDPVLRAQASASGASLAAVNLPEKHEYDDQSRISDQRDTSDTGELSSVRVAIDYPSGRVTVHSHQASIDQIIDNLSERSRRRIRFLGSPPSVRYSLAVIDSTIDDFLGELAALIPGGAMVASVQNGRLLDETYIILTSDIVRYKKRRSDTYMAIDEGAQPDSLVLKSWLQESAQFEFSLDPSVASLSLLPVLKHINENFAIHAPMVYDLLVDPEQIRDLRFLMLELVSQNFDFAGSKSTLAAIFDQAGDDVLSAKAGLALALHYRADIGDEVIASYHDCSAHARFFHAGTLAQLKREDSLPFLLSDASTSEFFALRSAAITAAIDIASLDSKTVQVANELILAAANPESHWSVLSDRERMAETEREVVAMHTVIALEQQGMGSVKYLIRIAEIEDIALNVRLTALDSIARLVSLLPPEDKAELLRRVEGVIGGDFASDPVSLSRIENRKLIIRSRADR